MDKISIQEITNKIKDIPPLPQSIHKILEITRDPEATAQDLSKVLMKDQALTTKILKLVNSSYYGFSRKISTISHAIMYLGFKKVKSLALTATSYQMLNQEIPSYSLEKGSLWHHSLTCAIGSRIIAERIKYADPEEAYTAGLIHDIGKTVLKHYSPELFEKILEHTESRNIPYNEAEQEILGLSHAQIGGEIVKQWNLPDALVYPVKFHHSPQDTEEYVKLTYIIHLANNIAKMLGTGMGKDGMKYVFREETMDTLKLSEPDVEMIMAELSDVIHEDHV